MGNWNKALNSIDTMMSTFKKPHFAIFLTLIVWSVTSCSEDGGTCLNGSGEPDLILHELPVIDAVSLHDGLHLHITAGDVPNLQIEGGKNLISNVRYDIEDGMLMLYDDNRCHWLRSAENLQLTLTVPHLRKVEHQGYGNITSDVLQFPAIDIISTQATGNINLEIDNQICRVNSNGDGDIILSGMTEIFSAGYFHTRGKLIAYDLNAKEAAINNDGYSEMHVRATNLLRITVQRSGPVYYYHEPAELITSQIGSGLILYKE